MKPQFWFMYKGYVFQCIIFFLFRESFFYNVNNTKFENYLQTCFEILFALSKLKIII